MEKHTQSSDLFEELEQSSATLLQLLLELDSISESINVELKQKMEHGTSQ